MYLHVVVNNNCDQTKKLLIDACYSGDRFVVEGEDGVLAAIVPLEDLEILERIENQPISKA